MLFLAGDITQWHLPAGMKDLNLRATEVTGKAQLIKRVWRSEGEFLEHYLNRLRFSRNALLHSSLSSSPRFLLFSYLVALRSFSQVTLRSGIFPWA
jgi:hypothetical protein